MIAERDIEKLAALCRIALSKEEGEKLRHDIEAILAYISEIGDVKLDHTPSATTPYSALTNVMREDGEPTETGRYKEALLSQAPAREGDYVKVKKILTQK